MSRGDRQGPAPEPTRKERSPALDALLGLLSLEHLDRDLLLGDPGPGEGRLFGGLVAAQSVMAAGLTVEAGHLHSLHAYFLRPGGYGAPIRFVVDRIRDGRTFTTRRVVAHQGGEAIFNLSASFSSPQEGPAHQEPMPDAEGPEGLPEFAQVRARWFGEPEPPNEVTGPMELRIAGAFDEPLGERAGQPRTAWMRLTGPPPEDPLMRIALLVYASDRTLLGSALRPLGLRPGPDVQITSLDHAFWLHRTPALDDWFLYTSQSPAAHSSRALVHGVLYEHGGERIASVAQEGLIRFPNEYRKA